MQSMGKCPSEEELLMMIMEVDEDGSGAIEFAEVRDETVRSKLLTVCKILLLLCCAMLCTHGEERAALATRALQAVMPGPVPARLPHFPSFSSFSLITLS